MTANKEWISGYKLEQELQQIARETAYTYEQLKNLHSEMIELSDENEPVENDPIEMIKLHGYEMCKSSVGMIRLAEAQGISTMNKPGRSHPMMTCK